MRCFIMRMQKVLNFTYILFNTVIKYVNYVSKLFSEYQLKKSKLEKNNFYLQNVLQCNVNNIYCFIKYLNLFTKKGLD